MSLDPLAGNTLYSTFTQNLGMQFADFNDNGAFINALSSGVQSTQLSYQTSTTSMISSLLRSTVKKG